jgi:DNA-binding ferritin-like protein (Dps family)/drug/metabolite transporter superfamily protein YnfA
LIAVIICILAIASFAAVIVVRLKRNEYTKEFNKEYYEVYEAVQDGLKNSNLTRFESKEVQNDILSMLYHAQKDGRKAQDVIGEDTQEFIKKVEQSYGYRNSILFAALNGVLYLAFVLSLMQFTVYIMRSDGVPFFETLMSVSILPYMVLLSFIVIPIMRRLIAKQKIGRSFAAAGGLVVIYFAAHEIFYRVNHNIKWIESYLNGEFVFISSYIMLAAVVVICAVSAGFKIYLKQRSLKRM